ncbi:MAG: transposase [Desulfobacterales bacterium]
MGLKAYKRNPKAARKKRLEAMFEKIFTQTTASASLNLALKRIYSNKSELLLVLERPDIPLHNNGAENAIREYVKKRKISGGTRSDAGRRCRDTFTSLKKTCRKLGLSFWQYLKDRIENVGLIPDLPELVRQQILNPG